MKIKLALLISMVSVSAFADRLGSLRSSADVLLTTQALSASTISVYPASSTASFPFGYAASTATYGNASSTSFGNHPYTVFSASGTSQAIEINLNGQPSGGVQNDVGGLTVNALGPGGPAVDMVVIHSSYPSSQAGSAMLSLINDNPNRNDPMAWFHRVNNDSSPEMRWDSPSPNMELVNTSTDNAHGLGKWEPFAIANHGIDLQCGSNRAYDNSTFENLCYEHPLSRSDIQPSGMWLNAQSLANDSGILTSSDTSVFGWQTQNNHLISLTAPLNPTASWTFALPSTPNNSGQVLYQANNGRGNNNNARQWEFTTGGATNDILSFNSGSAPTWTHAPTLSTVTLTGQLVLKDGTVITSTSTLGGSGGGSGIVSPGTFTWTNTQGGINVSTITASSSTINGQLTINSQHATPGAGPTTANLILFGNQGTDNALEFEDPDQLSFSTNPIVGLRKKFGTFTIGAKSITGDYPGGLTLDFTPGSTSGKFTSAFSSNKLNGTLETVSYANFDSSASITGAGGLGITYGITASTALFSGPQNSTFTYGVTAGSITLQNQTNTAVVFMNGSQLATSSIFEWNGTTLTARGVQAGTITASGYITSAYGVSAGSATIGSGGIYMSSSTASFVTYIDSNSSTAQTIDWTTGNIHYSRLTGNVTYTFTAPPHSAHLVLHIDSGDGTHTVTWPAAVHWGTLGAPTLATSANKIDMVFCDWLEEKSFYACAGAAGATGSF